MTLDETTVRELERFTARMVRGKMFPFAVVAAVLEERRRVRTVVMELLELLQAGEAIGTRAVGVAACKVERALGVEPEGDGEDHHFSSYSRRTSSGLMFK